MIITTLFIIKTVVTIVLVLLLSLLAEYVSPKVSGIISGIPTGTAIILFFFGLEHGAEFAAKSSIFNLAGMLSLQVFIYLYLVTSKKDSIKNILLSSITAIVGYLIIIFLLKQITFTILTSLLIPLIFIPLFTYLFKKINNTIIKNKIKLGPNILLARAIIASIAVLAVTSIAQFVGPELAGLFSAFPTTVFPLILIIHYTYGKEHVHTIIKNIPKGQWAMVIYVLGVFFLYPMIGIYLGTIISYFFVIAYLLIIFKLQNKDS